MRRVAKEHDDSVVQLQSALKACDGVDGPALNMNITNLFYDRKHVTGLHGQQTTLQFKRANTQTKSVLLLCSS